MPPDNREEYRQLSVETLQWMLNEVRKHHDDILIMKTERRMLSCVFGGLSAIVVELVAKFVFHA